MTKQEKEDITTLSNCLYKFNLCMHRLINNGGSKSLQNAIIIAIGYISTDIDRIVNNEHIQHADIIEHVNEWIDKESNYTITI